MNSKRLTAEALRGIAAAADGNTSDTRIVLRVMIRILADRAALEQRVRELEAALRPFAKMAGMPSYDVEFHWNDEYPKAAAKALADGGGG